MTRSPPYSTLFPYTTLFRSALAHGLDRPGPVVAGCIWKGRFCRVAAGADVGLDRIDSRRADADKHLAGAGPRIRRSEEHTSELQSRLHLVCRLLLEKTKVSA